MRLSLLIVLLIIPSAFAAVIEGTVYDLSLEPVESVVQIDSTPQQRMVAKAGEYSFTIPTGNYRIVAEGTDGNTTENITIIADGTYTIDLFLFPDLSEEVYDGDAETLAVIAQPERSWLLWIGVLAVLVGVGVLWHFRYRSAAYAAQPVTRSPQHDTEAILAMLKANDGRMTQKELRDRLPHSEAKVSLMLAELEAKGKIEKIKRGRSNLLLLK